MSFIIFAFKCTVWWEPYNLVFISDVFFFSFLSLIYSDFIPVSCSFLSFIFLIQGFSFFSYPQTLVWGRCQFSSALFFGWWRGRFSPVEMFWFTFFPIVVLSTCSPFFPISVHFMVKSSWFKNTPKFTFSFFFWKSNNFSSSFFLLTAMSPPLPYEVLLVT